MKKPIALVAAMEEEVAALLAAFPPHDTRTHFNTQLFHSRFEAQDLIIAQSGVGKANAACTLALLLSDFDPGCVINTGCAGGLQPHQKVLDFVVPEAVVYTDVDLTPLGFTFGQMMGCEPRFKASPELLAQFQSLVVGLASPPTCHRGLLGSSDTFIYRPEQIADIRARFNNEVQCVEMEGGAIAQACTRFGVPFLILRALSDFPDRGDNALAFQTFLAKAARNSADLCRRLIQRLALMESLA